jgi:general secretion pathway protein F
MSARGLVILPLATAVAAPSAAFASSTSVEDLFGEPLLPVLLLVGLVVASGVIGWIAYRRPGIAVSIAPSLALLVAVLSLAFEFVAGLLIAGGLLVIMYVGALLAKPPRGDPWPRNVAKWVLIIMGLLVSGVPVLRLALLPSSFLLVVIVAAVIRAVGVGRHGLVGDVFEAIRSATRQHLPLGEVLTAQSVAHRGRPKHVLRAVADRIQRGQPLSQALREGFPECPGHALAMVSAGERAGRLPAALDALHVDLAKARRRSVRFSPVNPLYPLVVLCLTVGPMILAGAFIFPKYARIFDSLALDPNPVTDTFISLGERVGLLFVPLALAIVLIPALWVHGRFARRDPGERAPLMRWADALKWRLPVVRWFERHRSLLRATAAMRLSLSADGLVDRAIEVAAAQDVNAQYRRRLLEWLRRVRGGQDVAAAARASGAGRALAWAFDQEVNPSNAPAALEAVERSWRASYSYARNLARFVFWPLCIILCGVMVAFVAYALFAPLAHIIQRTCESVMP